MSRGLLRTCRGTFVRCTFVTPTAMSSESARALMKPSSNRPGSGASLPIRGGAAMSRLLRFTGSVRRDRAVDRWMTEHSGELGAIAQRWFEVVRKCGGDVREL